MAIYLLDHDGAMVNMSVALLVLAASRQCRVS